MFRRKHLVVCAFALSLVIGSTAYGYDLQRKLKPGIERRYKVSYRIHLQPGSSGSESLVVEEGTLTEVVDKVAEQEGSQETVLRYLYEINGIKRGNAGGGLLPVSIEEFAYLDKDYKITKLSLPKTMLPYYMNAILAPIPKNVKSVTEKWSGAILNNNFTFEAEPVLPTPNLIIDYSLKEITPISKDQYNYCIEWGAQGMWLGRTSRRNGSLTLDNEGFILQAEFNLPSLIPGFLLSAFYEPEFLNKGLYTPVQLRIEYMSQRQEEEFGTFVSSAVAPVVSEPTSVAATSSTQRSIDEVAIVPISPITGKEHSNKEKERASAINNETSATTVPVKPSQPSQENSTGKPVEVKEAKGSPRATNDSYQEHFPPLPSPASSRSTPPATPPKKSSSGNSSQGRK